MSEYILKYNNTTLLSVGINNPIDLIHYSIGQHLPTTWESSWPDSIVVRLDNKKSQEVSNYNFLADIVENTKDIEIQKKLIQHKKYPIDRLKFFANQTNFHRIELLFKYPGILPLDVLEILNTKHLGIRRLLAQKGLSPIEHVYQLCEETKHIIDYNSLFTHYNPALKWVKQAIDIDSFSTKKATLLLVRPGVNSKVIKYLYYRDRFPNYKKYLDIDNLSKKFKREIILENDGITAEDLIYAINKGVITFSEVVKSINHFNRCDLYSALLQPDSPLFKYVNPARE